jgi:3-oxoacyl-[acyl-carrier protein] reductase
MDLHLNGKVAMVSGGAQGLGYAVAQALAAEGCKVSISDLNEDGIRSAAERLAKETGASVIGLAADIRSAEALGKWHQETMRAFGGVDLLYPNAGGPPPGDASSFDDAAWQNTFELLLLSVIRMVRLAVPVMAERGGGSIVIPTSSSIKQPIPNLGLSNVMRGAVAALAKTLANELAAKKIRVNQIVPGRIATERITQLDNAASKRLGIAVEEQRKRQLAAIPVGRYGDPEEFARAAAFLFSDAASYITGAALQVDGGMIRSVL